MPAKLFFPGIEIPTNKQKMVAEMSYTSVATVVESWEGIRRLPSYEEVAGVKLFRRYVNSFFVSHDGARFLLSFL